MKIYQNVSLKGFHTFHVEVTAKTFIELEQFEEIDYILDNLQATLLFILGGGSNVLFLKQPEVVLRVNFRGIHIVDENEDFVWLSAKAGEPWDDFVAYCVSQGWGGLENLSLIPGTVGASPIQNIGAYGVEVKDTIWKVNAIHLLTGVRKSFYAKDCNFSYRDSYFKQHPDEKWLIYEVIYKLTKKHHRYNISYGNLATEFKEKPVSLQSIRQFVIQQRQSKLPDPDEYGNAGSFFKNPVVDITKLNDLKKIDSSVPYFEHQDGNYKVPAAWLIEKAGLKGIRNGNVGTFPRQPLVIVNYGGASSQEIFDFSAFIIQTVVEKFGIELEREVNVFK